MDQGQLTDGGPEGLGNSTTSGPTGTSGGPFRRMEPGNLENERVHRTHNVLNYHTRFLSSFGGNHEGPAAGYWNGCDPNLDYTSALDETDDYGRLPG